MIQSFSDQAANERTFLAWVRTAIAVIAFGFVIEKFNLFVLTVLTLARTGLANNVRLERLSGSLGRHEGLAFIDGAGRAHCERQHPSHLRLTCAAPASSVTVPRATSNAQQAGRTRPDRT